MSSSQLLRARRGLAAVLLSLASTSALAGPAQHPLGQAKPPAGDEYEPKVEPASEEAREAMARFQLAEGFAVSLFAAEPLLANPVCFCIDRLGRFYVAETFRHFAGVTDMREHMDWLNEDLANQTVAQRMQMIRRHEGERFREYGLEHERVRRIVDTDGDGRADEASVFADEFQDPAAGIGAGLLARGQGLWYTCIPDLWRLEDRDDDGRAEERHKLHTGFGVKISLLGHDLHGLVLGPDGRLYFSIGDRGFHVETEGRTLAHAHTGAVLRCELDGSRLEVFATGLRNPQELVFDEAGNLFTGDNNSDGGDQARWVFVLEGSDQGWRTSYQHITQPNLRGPWNAEQLWQPYHEGQPAYIVPPIANISSGPSGLTIYPGSGWDDSWRGTFFLCDFRGDPNYSGVHSFRVAPRGAGFELVDAAHFLWGSLVTDVDFGYDGGLYVTDWVDGWNKTGKGRIYKLQPKAARAASGAATVAALFARGFEVCEESELVALLGHADKRVRLEAQLELAARGQASLPALLATARATDAGLARLHAVWGMAHIARRLGPGEAARAALAPLLELATDAQAELRAQVLRALGEGGFGVRDQAGVFEALTLGLHDDSPRVRLCAAQALGKLGDPRAVAPLFALARENADADPWLRHAAVSALEWLGPEAAAAISARAGDESPAVRRVALLVMRRERSAQLEAFLADPDPELVAEALRAIYDLPLQGSYRAVTGLIEDPRELSETSWRRIVNACRHLGGERSALLLGGFALREGAPLAVRVEALEILAEWAEPDPLDRVTGDWHPIGARPAGFLGELALGLAPGLIATGEGRLARAWVALAQAGLETTPPERSERLARDARQIVADARLGADARRAALRLLAEGLPGWQRSLELALEDPSEALRAQAFGLLDRLEAPQAIGLLRAALTAPSVPVVQGAVRALARIEGREVDDLLVGAFERLGPEPDHAGHALELIEAAERRGGERMQAALRRYREASSPAPEPALASPEARAAWSRFCSSLSGGDPAAGRKLFFEKAETSCVRCHRVPGSEAQSTATGGEAGPDLSTVGSRLTPERILESIVFPNAAIAEGFENWILALEDADPQAGRIVAEGPESLTLELRDGSRIELGQEEISARRRDLSGMPQDVSTHLGRGEMRDLVAFLSTLREP